MNIHEKKPALNWGEQKVILRVPNLGWNSKGIPLKQALKDVLNP